MRTTLPGTCSASHVILDGGVRYQQAIGTQRSEMVRRRTFAKKGISKGPQYRLWSPVPLQYLRLHLLQAVQ